MEFNYLNMPLNSMVVKQNHHNSWGMDEWLHPSVNHGM